MPNYRSAKYGMVSADLLDPSLVAVNDLLKLFVRNSRNDFDFLITPKNIAEVFNHVSTIMSGDFRSWLAANYNNGTGVRAEMVRRILSFLNGEISGQLVVEGVRIDLSRCQHFKRIGENAKPLQATPVITDPKWLQILNDVTPGDFYALVEGIGIEALALMILTLNGETGDV